MKRLSGIALISSVILYKLLSTYFDYHLYFYSFENYKIFDATLNLLLFSILLCGSLLAELKVKLLLFIAGFVLASYHVSTFLKYGEKYKSIYEVNKNSTLVLTSYDLGALGSGLVNVELYQKNNLLMEPITLRSYEHIMNGEIVKYGNCCVKITMTTYDRKTIEDIISLNEVLIRPSMTR